MPQLGRVGRRRLCISMALHSHGSRRASSSIAFPALDANVPQGSAAELGPLVLWRQGGDDPLHLGLVNRETPEERRLRKRVFLKDDIHWYAAPPTTSPSLSLSLFLSPSPHHPCVFLMYRSKDDT